MIKMSPSKSSNFEDLLSSKQTIQQECLEKIVEELNDNKERAIYRFLGDSGSEDFLWSLVTFLSSDILRIASNAAYVIGSLAETELGSHRVLSLTKGKRAGSIIQDLTSMLVSDDQECVMNAAGTLGTLAETIEGRAWMITQPCIDKTITHITNLLAAENNWTASNAALVLARLTISEEGCDRVLSHHDSAQVLTRLINSLGNDSAGRGMNAAFAIGRLLDMSPGKTRLLNCKESEKMISSLCRMLIKGDMGGSKNACFAVSCLAMDADGNQRVLTNQASNDVINRLTQLLGNSVDIEAAWFAAMTLRTMSSHKRGVLTLRENDLVISALNKNFDKPSNTKELNEEIQKTLNHLRRLDAPPAPVAMVTSPCSIQVSWPEMEASCGMDITYKLFDGPKLMYKGKETKVELEKLTPNTTYNFKLRACSVGDESPLSDCVTITTDEDCPSAPCCLRVVGSTPTQLRIAWNPPEHPNGVLRGYSVYLGEKLLDSCHELSFIVGRLQPSTSYNVSVCGNTLKGGGERASICAQTDELGAHAPGKPSVTVIGRNEVHVTWNPPSVPLGRFFRFELLANKEVVYSGTERSFRATNLVPDTDYLFTVCAITSEGRCESDVTKKRTQKDKSQIEPGRHKFKTHSFKAKEFLAQERPPMEKAKTQMTFSVPRSKNKKPSPHRPQSCVSSASDKSLKHDHGKEGTWAVTSSTSGSSPTSDRPNLAILGGGEAPRYQNKTHDHEAYGGVRQLLQHNNQSRTDTSVVTSSAGQLSIFLNKSKTEFPLRGKQVSDKNAHQKVTIEPVSWNELISFDDDTKQQQQHNKRQLLPRQQQRSSKLLNPGATDKEKSFINVVINPRGKRSSLARMGAPEPPPADLGTAPDARMMREKHLQRVRHRRSKRAVPTSPGSDSSNEEADMGHVTRDLSSKLKPLSLTTDPLTHPGALSHPGPPTSDHIFLDDPKSIVARLKTPSKGYWSDHDAYPPIRSKKSNSLAPINYRKFTGAHRPTKTFRQESPLLTETWLSDLPSSGETNKYKFIPTQMRTQPAHLPKQAKSGSDRLESLTQIDFRREAKKETSKPQPSYYQDRGEIPHSPTLAPKQTRTYPDPQNPPKPHRKLSDRKQRNFSPFHSNLLHSDTRCLTRDVIQGDAV